MDDEPELEVGMFDVELGRRLERDPYVRRAHASALWSLWVMGLRPSTRNERCCFGLTEAASYSLATTNAGLPSGGAGTCSPWPITPSRS